MPIAAVSSASRSPLWAGTTAYGAGAASESEHELVESPGDDVEGDDRVAQAEQHQDDDAQGTQGAEKGCADAHDRQRGQWSRTRRSASVTPSPARRAAATYDAAAARTSLPAAAALGLTKVPRRPSVTTTPSRLELAVDPGDGVDRESDLGRQRPHGRQPGAGGQLARTDPGRDLAPQLLERRLRRGGVDRVEPHSAASRTSIHQQASPARTAGTTW